MANKVILTGNVGKEPDIKTLGSGNAVANFSFATSETYKNKQGEKVTNTSWHNIVIWGKLADVVEKYVKKGDHLYLEGKIQYRSWDDKDGNKKYITEIVCDVMEMYSKKDSSTALDPKQSKPSNNDGPPESDKFDNDDNLPF